MKRVLPLLVLAAAVAACGGEDDASRSGQDTGAAPTTQPEPATTSGASSTLALRLYFLQDGRLAATSRRIARTQAVGRAALDALADGPTAAERETGFTSACGSVDSIAIANGDALVAPAPEGPCAAQTTWTLTQFQTVERVNGKSRADYESLVPAVSVDSPAPFEQVRSPLRVTGTANTYEATFEYDLVDAAGKTVAHDFVTATSGSGTRGTFDFTIEFDVQRAGTGKLVVFESSAEDGSRIHVREIPLRLAS